MKYALIDESDRLYDPEDKILVFSAVVTDNLTELERIIVKARKRIPKKGNRRKERLSEIKFSLAGDKTRRFILQELAKQKLKIYKRILNRLAPNMLTCYNNPMNKTEKVAERINQVFEKLEAGLPENKRGAAQRFIHPFIESTDVMGFSDVLATGIIGLRGNHQVATEVITHPNGFPIALIVASRETINILFPATDYHYIDSPQPNLTFIQLSPKTL